MKMSGKIFLFIAAAVTLGVLAGSFSHRMVQRQIAAGKAAKTSPATSTESETA